MRVSVDGRPRSGRAVDLQNTGASATTLVAAIRDPDDERVRCRTPGPVHEYAGHVSADVAVPVRSAVAAAARSLRAAAPQDRRLAELEAERAGLDDGSATLDGAREAAASSADVPALREEVARLRGRVEALREADRDAADAEAALREAARRLSEAETDRAAAEQTLAAARREARAVRDRRERRLRLTDRIENRRREARTHLARTHYDRFARAVRAVPGEAEPGTVPADFDGPDAVAALAVARFGAVAAPVVVEGPWFDDAAAAARRLDAPVVLV